VVFLLGGVPIGYQVYNKRKTRNLWVQYTGVGSLISMGTPYRNCGRVYIYIYKTTMLSIFIYK